MEFLVNVLVVVVAVNFLCMSRGWPFDVKDRRKVPKVNQRDPSTIKSTSENSIDMVLSWDLSETKQEFSFKSLPP